MSEPKMFYFGPWDRAGHYVCRENGYTDYEAEKILPWTPGQLDGGLQPHFNTCAKKRSQYSSYCSCGSGPEGPALIHHKDGWTALAFWDRSVDTRGACCSVYLAQGTFGFDEMVALASTRFAHRWNKMPFKVIQFVG